MLKNLCVILSLTVLFRTDASPVKSSYEDLDSILDYGDLYQIEEEDLEDFSKLFNTADDASKSAANSKTKTNVNTSGYKKKKTANKGIQSNHDIKDLKKFYKLAGVHDQGAFDDNDEYLQGDAVAVGALGMTVNENKTYKKGSKTRGFHRVHHKDEYKKDREFYEDDNTSGSTKKFGGNGLGFIGKAGGSINRGHFHHDRQKGIYGKQGYLDQGSLSKDLKGYSDLQGFDGSFSSSA